MRAQAAVADGRGGLAVRDIEVGDPGLGEVLIDLRASGVCHTDHQTMGEGSTGTTGQRGAGVVAARGPGAPPARVGGGGGGGGYWARVR